MDKNNNPVLLEIQDIHKEFDDKKIYVCENVNELTLLLCKIAKLEIY